MNTIRPRALGRLLPTFAPRNCDHSWPTQLLRPGFPSHVNRWFSSTNVLVRGGLVRTPQTGQRSKFPGGRVLTGFVPRKDRPPPTGLIFSQDDVPPLEFWREREFYLDGSGLTAEDCHRAATHYCELAPKSTLWSMWLGKLQQVYEIDPYTLHYTAMLLLHRSEPGWKLILHMFDTASSLGYQPSTLALMYVWTRGKDKNGRLPQHEAFFNTEGRFNGMLSDGRNPDALTLKGVLCLRRGQGAGAALQYFDRAIAASAGENHPYAPEPQPPATAGTGEGTDSTPVPRGLRWTYEPLCHMSRGSILAQQGRLDEAAAAFRVAALELDMPEAYLQLAKLLPEGSEHREEYLRKVAMTGNAEACRMLASAELAKLEKLGTPKRGSETVEQMQHRVMAAEWLEIAGETRMAERVRTGQAAVAGEASSL